MIQLMIFFAALAFCIAGASFDIIMTNRGLRANLAVEGNGWIVKLFGNKPSLLQLCLYEVGKVGMICAPTLGWNNPALVGGSIGGLLAVGGLHIIGALKWRLLLSGKTLPTKASLTAFQKFLGWFGYNW